MQTCHCQVKHTLICIHFRMIVDLLELKVLFLSFHKSENTVNRQKKNAFSPCFRGKYCSINQCDM